MKKTKQRTDVKTKRAFSHTEFARALSLLLTLAVLFCSYAFTATAQSADTVQNEEEPIQSAQQNGHFLNEVSFEGTGEYIYAVYELDDRREENVKHFSMPDGTYRAVVYGEAVHRLDADGKWTDIDNSLTLKQKNGMSLYSDAEGRISFAGSAQPSTQGSFLFSLTENGYLLAMALIGNTNGSGSLNFGNISATASVAAVTNPTAKEALTSEDSVELQFEKLSAVDNRTEIVYSDILSGTDLEYTLRSNSIKENIVVKSPQASYVYSFAVATKGLSAALSDDGSITLSDNKTNATVYYIPAPYMTDADGNVSHDVSYSLAELSDGTYVLTVTASTEWINAQDRAFPIKIDPTVMSRGGIHDTYISNLVDEATSSEYGHEDYLSLMPEFSDENGVLRRTIGLIRGDLPSIPETAIITSASLIMNLSFPGQTSGEAAIVARNITAPWNEDDASWWPACDNIGYTATMLRTPITSASSNLVALDITPFVQAANCITANYYGVALFNGSLPNCGEIRIKSSEASENYLNTVVIYVDGIQEGVYSIKNLTTNKWLSTPINSGDYTDFSTITQKTFSTDPTANFDNSREALFKISIIPGHSKDRYVLRPMLNNNFVVNYYGGELVPIFTSDDESYSTDDQTFYIEADANGYTIKTVSTEETVFASDTLSSVDVSYEFESGEIWQFTRYEGAEKYGAAIKESCTFVAGELDELTPVVWSTRVDANIPFMYVSVNDTDKATGTWNASTQKFELSVFDEGTAQTVVVIRDACNNTQHSINNESLAMQITLPFDNGDYFIRNKATSLYIQADSDFVPDPVNENALPITELWTFDGATDQRWEIKHIKNGYYRIASKYNEDVISVPINDIDEFGVTLTQESYSINTNRQLWKISAVTSSAYKIQAKTAIAANSNLSMVSGSTSSTNGADVQQNYYVEDANYIDEWYFERLLPTSGYEIDYNPNMWNQDYNIRWNTNCYSYALNSQINPSTNTFETMQPGQSDGLVLYRNILTAEKVLQYVLIDAENLNFIFEPIGKYEACEEGSYKVALVVHPYEDYHWYRQNPDNSWSHKPGRTEVTNLDASGQIIYDPETADRAYSHANYSIFVGFFKVTPLNNLYEINRASNNSIAEIIKTTENKSDIPSVEAATFVKEGMLYSEVTKLLGLPQKQLAFGLMIFEYELSDNYSLIVEYTRNNQGNYVVQNAKFQKSAYEVI